MSSSRDTAARRQQADNQQQEDREDGRGVSAFDPLAFRRSLLSGDTGRSDRRVAWILLAFFLALYLLTGGGHGYSPDGEFAYRLARSVTIDPRHEYLQRMKRGLDQWGFVVPTLSQPLVLIGEPLSHILPQKDHAVVDGHDFILGVFRPKDSPPAAPTVGAAPTGVADSYARTNLKGGPSDRLAVISFLAKSENIPQGATVAELTVLDSSGNSVVFPLRAGVETAEWSLGKSAANADHQMARVASIWGGNTSGRNYYAELNLGRVMEPRELRIRYLLPEGNLYIRSLALLNSATGAFEPIPSDSRFWSVGENDELYTRFFFSFYDAFITAVACVLLFALARLLGYSQVVGIAAALVYGVATQAWPFAKYDFSEPTLVVMVLTTLYLIYRWGQERRDRYLLLAGIAALACVGTKYASAVLIAPMLLQVLLLHWEKHPSWWSLPKFLKPALLFCLPILAVAAPALFYLSHNFNYDPTFLRAWDGIQSGWLPLPIYMGLVGLLFSPGKSFFLFSPPTLLGVASVVPFVRRHGVRAFGLLAVALVYFTLYSKKPAWHAGAGWGPRYQVVVIPLVILIALPLIQKAIEGRHRWARYALVATFVLGVTVQLLGVAKSFDYYLGVFRTQVVTQLPGEGRQYGIMPEYYEEAKGLDDGNSITATMLAVPFSPILAHAWLLSADLLSLGPSYVQPLKDKVLSNPPWKLWGIDVTPSHPEYGLGLDFWSMHMRTDFPSFGGFLVAIGVVVALLEVALIFSGARVISLLFHASRGRIRAVTVWVTASTLVLLVFDGIHFVL